MAIEAYNKNEQIISAMNICRSFLYVNDVITSNENAEISKRIHQRAQEDGTQLTCRLASQAMIVCDGYTYKEEY